MWCDESVSKSRRQNPSKPRFLQNGRLLTEEGWTLTAGPSYISAREAREALREPIRVLLHNYPHAEDITSDPRRVAAVLADTGDEYDLFHHTAEMYSDGTHHVLVFVYHH